MIRLLLARGAEGLPSPTPIAFDQGFGLPPSPNTCLLAPAGASLPAHGRFGPWHVSAGRLWDMVQEVAAAEPRCFPLASWPDLRQAQWVVRSRLMNYPDIVVAQVMAMEATGGAAALSHGLVLYSRSLVGWSDLGVNAGRLARWRAGIERRLG
jgi:hypothetical protein